MKKVIINGIGLSMATSVTGIPRYCREIILRLDQLFKENKVDVEYAYLKGAENAVLALSEFSYIRPVQIDSENKRLASMIALPRYIKKQKAIGVNLSPEPLISKNQIACIHDLRPVVYSQYDSWHFKLSYRFILSVIKKTAKKIVTVSDYQKKAILKLLKIKEQDKVCTIYNGWEHIEQVALDTSIFNRYPSLSFHNFYYALGSLAPHKNFNWIMEVAKRNPNQLFAIAGGKDLRNWKDNIETNELSNVIFLGYVTDEENKALMRACKAYLHPSKYEGFGIPPLEALACGTPIIISNATCLPEIYEDCAHYFDPDDYSVDLNSILQKPVASPNKILEKCSWERSAKQWFDLIMEETQ